eukprot:364487-Chlamydomonas_euryale.AAC.11
MAWHAHEGTVRRLSRAVPTHVHTTSAATRHRLRCHCIAYAAVLCLIVSSHPRVDVCVAAEHALPPSAIGRQDDALPSQRESRRHVRVGDGGPANGASGCAWTRGHDADLARNEGSWRR